MELSAIIKANNLTLTRPESDLVARLSPGISAGAEDQYDQRMKSLAAARDVLKQLPDRKTLVRRDKMEKAGMLKERLKMLRQQIPFMSPSAVKSLKTEMRQIAAQLASLSGESGGVNGSAVATPAVTVAKTPESGSNAETAPGTAQLNEPGPENAGTGREPHATPEIALLADGVKSEGGTAEDRQLKEAVVELESLYKAVLAALKRKLDSGGGNGRLPGQTLRLRVYADMPDGTGSVAIRV